MTRKMPERKSDPSREARSVVRYLRISPRKVRIVINAIRRQPVSMALTTLFALKKKAARLVEKGLKSAVANARVKGLEEGRLLVSEIKADGGPHMKRFMSRSMGRADQILKRSTHLTIVIREGERFFGPPSETKEGRGKEKVKTKKVPKKQMAAKA